MQQKRCHRKGVTEKNQQKRCNRKDAREKICGRKEAAERWR
jgi:hypothetical protein